MLFHSVAQRNVKDKNGTEGNEVDEGGSEGKDGLRVKGVIFQAELKFGLLFLH